MCVLPGCSGTNNEFTPEIFKTKEEAINNYIEQENHKGSIVQLNIRDSKKILLNVVGKNVYFLGELVEQGGGYSAFKITATFDFSGSSGASWSFSTLDKSNYQIAISSDGITFPGYFITEIASYISIKKSGDTSEKVNYAVEQIRSYQIIK